MEHRREFLKKSLYVAPLILTVAVRPSHAASSYTPGTGNGTNGGNGGNGGNGDNGGETPGEGGSTVPSSGGRVWAGRLFR